MTTYVNPTNSFTTTSEEIGRVFRYSGHTHSFIAESSTLVSDVDSVGVNTGPLNAFAHTTTSGLDFEVDTGEAMIQGALLAKDTQTTITLPPNDSGTIYLAWNPSIAHEIVIDYDASGNVDLPRTALYDFTTDGSTVISSTDVRILSEHIDVRNTRYETTDGSGLTVDSASTATTASNANNLGGSPPSAYARLDQDETVNGIWTWNGTINTDLINIGEDDDQLRIGSNPTDNRIWLAPIINGSPAFGHEITYLGDDNRWLVESPSFRSNADVQTDTADVLTGKAIARRADITIPNSAIRNNDEISAHHSLLSSEQAEILRISFMDQSGSGDPASGCELRIEGEGGGQSQTFTSSLTNTEFSNPLHTVDGPGSVKAVLRNDSGSEQILNCNVVMQIT